MTHPNPEHLPTRPNRRATDGGPLDTARARQRRLVAHIAGDPDLLMWLGTSKARTLYAVAADLVHRGHREAAEVVRHRADELTTGNVSPF